MSSNIIASILMPDNIIRDFVFTHDGTAVNVVHDVLQSFNMVALDLFIRNRGGAALTVAINGQNPTTVDPGDVYTLNDVKYWIVNVQSAVIYDFQIFGVLLNTLKRRGIL